MFFQSCNYISILLFLLVYWVSNVFHEFWPHYLMMEGSMCKLTFNHCNNVWSRENSFIFPHSHFSVKWQDNKIVLHLLDFTSSCKCNTTGWTKVTTTSNGCLFWIVSSPASPLLYFCAELHENNVILDQSFLYSSCYRTHFVKGHALLASFFFIHDIVYLFY